MKEAKKMGQKCQREEERKEKKVKNMKDWLVKGKGSSHRNCWWPFPKVIIVKYFSIQKGMYQPPRAAL